MKAFVITVVCDDCLRKEDFCEASLRLALNSQSVSIMQVAECTPVAAAAKVGVPLPETWGSWAMSWLWKKK